MIKYQLRCEAQHEFEGWFGDSADYEAQAAQGLLSCPICESRTIGKAIMAPSVAGRRSARAKRLAEMKKTIAEAAARAREYVEKNYDYVGRRFPEEARKIHYGEVEPRGIYGEATGKEVKELVEEGVEVAPLPGSAKTDRADAAIPASKLRKNDSDASEG
jgi:hypothetical protein